MPDPARESDVVEELLIDCLDRDQSEWDEAIESACEEHPESAGELMERFRVVRGFGANTDPDAAAMPERLGEFEIEARLGSGGMGVVFRARQASLDRVVAVKLVRPEFQFFENAKLRFEREVSAIASLQHPSVVSIYSVGEERGMPFFAMELLAGRSLTDVLRGLSGRAPESLSGMDLWEQITGNREGSRIPKLFSASWVDACLDIVRQVAGALAHAHERGILHRDIKPSNIMLTPEGRAVILDFGLTGLLEGADAQRLTRSGTPIGTAAYMAPEQLQGISRVGPTADIYSLGVTLYELLTLRVPFEGDGLANTQKEILEGFLHPVRARNRTATDEVQTVCHVAMARHVGDRYASAADLAVDIQCLLDRRPIHAKPPGLVRRTRRWVQRRPARATSIVLAVLLAVGVPTVLWVVSSEHASELQKLVDSERDAKSSAVEARDRANAKATELSDVVEFLVNVFKQAIPGVSGGSPSLSAKDLIQRGSTTVDAALAERHASRARVKLILATIYGGFGEYPKSAELASAAAEYYAASETPENLPHLAESLRIQAASLGSDRKIGEAIPISQRALQVALRAHAEGDEVLLRFVENLAHLLALNGRFDASLKLAEQLKGVARGLVLAALGHGLMVNGKFDDALPHLERGVELLVDGDDLRNKIGARALQDLAHVRMVKKEYPASIALLERSIRCMSRWPTIGEDHYRVRVAQGTLLDTLLIAGKADKSIVARFAEVADHLERGLTPMHQYAVTARINEMKALCVFHRYEEALAVCDEYRLIEKAEKVIATHNRTTVANIHTRRSLALSRLGRYGAAQAAIHTAAEIHRSQATRRADPKLLTALFTHSVLSHKAGDPEACERAAREMVERTTDTILFLPPRLRGGKPGEAGVLGLQMLAQLANEAGDADATTEWVSRLKARQQRVQAAEKNRPAAEKR